MIKLGISITVHPMTCVVSPFLPFSIRKSPQPVLRSRLLRRMDKLRGVHSLCIFNALLGFCRRSNYKMTCRIERKMVKYRSV